MKNNLFKKFLALFLTGTMLAGVGCKDYDDDIDSINKRLDGMDVTISSLPEQLETIKKTIPNITSLTSKVNELAGKLDGVSDLKGQLEKLNGLESSLKQYVTTEIGKATTADALKKALGNYYATATALNDLDTAIEAITKKGGSIDAAVAAALKELREQDIANLKNNVGDWMGPKIQKYLADNGYNFTKADATTAASQEILNQIKVEQSEYWKAIETIVGKATINNLGQGVVSSTNLDEELKALIDKIGPLLDRVAELEGRIQSIVFVPEYLDEAQDNTVYFNAAAFIEIAGTNYYLGAKDEPTATMTFRVSPASKAAEITKDNVSFVVEPVKTRAAADPAFTVISVVPDEQSAKNGKFRVTVSTNYKFGSVANKALAFALNVNIPSKDKENKYGIDYTTSFLGADKKINTGGKINDQLVLAKKEGDKFVTVTMGTVHASELAYNSSETVTFFKDFQVYYTPETGKYYTLAEMWGDALAYEIKAPTTNPDVVGTAANYDLKAGSVAIKAAKVGDVSLIDNSITSKDYTINVTTGGKTLKLGTAKQKVTVVGINTNVMTSGANLMWKYATASATVNKNVYTAENIVLTKNEDGTNVLKAALYKQMEGYVKADALAAEKYTVEITKNGEVVTDITADIALISQPTLESDGQLANVTLTGDLKQTATYVVKAVYMHADKTRSTIETTVNVTGMPKLGTDDVFTLPAASKTYTGGYEFDLQKNYADLLWTDALKDAFGDKATFQGVIYAATATPTKAGKAALSADAANKVIKVTFDSDAAYATSYKPSIKFVDAKGTGLEVTFKSDVKLVEPTAKMTKNNAYFGSDGKAKASTTLSGSQFSVTDKELAQAFAYTGELQGTEIAYSVVNDATATDAAQKAQTAALKKLADAGKTIPAITGNVLTWNDWNNLDLIVKAELKLNGKVLDTEYFIVKIDDPVAATITVDSKVDATIYAGESTKTFKVASMLKLAAQNGTAIDPAANVFDATQDSGLNSNLATALGNATVKYTTTNINTAITVDEATGVVTLKDSGLEILTPIKVVVNVEYTYQFGTRTTKADQVIVTVKGGTKPAPAN
mgnify:FL=1